MKIIKLYAYLHDNLGDDLMLHILLTNFPQCKFWFDGVSPESNKFLRYPNFKNQAPLYLKYGRLNHILNILTLYKKEDFLIKHLCRKQTAKCCASLMIGGSMFIENSGIPPSERITLEESRLNVFPRFVIGVNFGPYSSDDYVPQFSNYFRRCKSVTFRDQHSYDLFHDLDCVSYAPDVVLNLDFPAPLDARGGNAIIISVIDTRGRGWDGAICDRYEQFILEFCNECLLRNMKPVLMSFCSYEGDSNAISRILALAGPDKSHRIGAYHYEGNMNEALNLLRDSSFVLATRFHAMILALLLHKPFFSIAYDPKIQWVLKDIKSDAFCAIDDIQRLCPANILDTYNHPLDVDDYIQDARDQFRSFEQFVDCDD